MEKDQSLYQILFSKTYDGWTEKLLEKKKTLKKILDQIDKLTEKHQRFYPHRQNVFKFLEKVPLNKIKVIIWGYRPYSKHFYKEPRALGYAYGVSEDDNLTSSLKNIYSEIALDYPLTYKSPLLETYNSEEKTLNYLSNQGVLLMNKILMEAVEDREIYENIWNRFIYILIEIINENVKNCVHVLFGKSEKLSSLIILIISSLS